MIGLFLSSIEYPRLRIIHLVGKLYYLHHRRQPDDNGMVSGKETYRRIIGNYYWLLRGDA